MSRYEYIYTIEARLQPAVAFHFFKLRALPCQNAAQRVVESRLTVEPGCTLCQATDGFGNAVQWGGYTKRHTEFRVVSSGTVSLSPYRLPEATPSPLYRHASSLTACNAALAEWARRAVNGTDEGQWAGRLMHAVAAHVAYERFATGNATTALQVFEGRRGVCQDYAHLMIAACRALGLAARYVAGMAPGEGETHAWVEVWHGGAWWAYDPTLGCCIVTLGYIKLAHGRDAADCPLNRGRFYAWTQETLTVSCRVSMQQQTINRATDKQP